MFKSSTETYLIDLKNNLKLLVQMMKKNNIENINISQLQDISEFICTVNIRNANDIKEFMYLFNEETLKKMQIKKEQCNIKTDTFNKLKQRDAKSEETKQEKNTEPPDARITEDSTKNSSDNKKSVANTITNKAPGTQDVFKNPS